MNNECMFSHKVTKVLVAIFHLKMYWLQLFILRSSILYLNTLLLNFKITSILPNKSLERLEYFVQHHRLLSLSLFTVQELINSQVII